MNKTSFTLSIKSPCTQQWSTMDQSDCGRFCSQCQKNVIDFTTMSDAQIIAFLEKNKTGICGRLHASQQGRIMHQTGLKSTSFFQRIVAALLFIGSTDEAISADLHKDQMEINEVSSQKSMIPNGFDSIVQDSSKNRIQGKVVDENSVPIEGCNIELMHSKYGVLTDSRGYYQIEIPIDIKENQFLIKVYYLGYTPYEFVVNKNELPLKDKLITLHEDHVGVLGDVCFVKTNHKWWQFWKK
jgi:hypothetical protein